MSLILENIPQAKSDGLHLRHSSNLILIQLFIASSINYFSNKKRERNDHSLKNHKVASKNQRHLNDVYTTKSNDEGTKNNDEKHQKWNRGSIGFKINICHCGN